MSFRENIKTYFGRIREKHKLTFINDRDYEEKWSLRVSSLNLVTLLALYTIVVFIIVLLLFRYTPLQSLFLEEGLYDNKQQVEENTQLIDSLYDKTRSTQLYLDDLKAILNDEPFDDTLYHLPDDSLENYNPDFTKNESDSVLRKKVESQENQDYSTESESYAFFFAPVKGIVSQSFNSKSGHVGVDVATKPEEPIKACLEGTVILTGWIQSEGKIVVIQHKDDLISVYKHCSSVLKKNGDKVQTGDPIGIVGNTGETSTGPHLHFELWKRGKALNPEAFISF